MANSIFYKWHPIEDLPANPDSLAKAELKPLAAIWEQREVFENAESLHIFNERLKRGSTRSLE